MSMSIRGDSDLPRLEDISDLSIGDQPSSDKKVADDSSRPLDGGSSLSKQLSRSRPGSELDKPELSKWQKTGAVLGGFAIGLGAALVTTTALAAGLGVAAAIAASPAGWAILGLGALILIGMALTKNKGQGNELLKYAVGGAIVGASAAFIPGVAGAVAMGSAHLTGALGSGASLLSPGLSFVSANANAFICGSMGAAVLGVAVALPHGIKRAQGKQAEAANPAHQEVNHYINNLKGRLADEQQNFIDASNKYEICDKEYGEIQRQVEDLTDHNDAPTLIKLTNELSEAKINLKIAKKEVDWFQSQVKGHEINLKIAENKPEGEAKELPDGNKANNIKDEVEKAEKSFKCWETMVEKIKNEALKNPQNEEAAIALGTATENLKAAKEELTTANAKKEHAIAQAKEDLPVLLKKFSTMLFEHFEHTNEPNLKINVEEIEENIKIINLKEDESGMTKEAKKVINEVIAGSSTIDKWKDQDVYKNVRTNLMARIKESFEEFDESFGIKDAPEQLDFDRAKEELEEKKQSEVDDPDAKEYDNYRSASLEQRQLSSIIEGEIKGDEAEVKAGVEGKGKVPPEDLTKVEQCKKKVDECQNKVRDADSLRDYYQNKIDVIEAARVTYPELSNDRTAIQNIKYGKLLSDLEIITPKRDDAREQLKEAKKDLKAAEAKLATEQTKADLTGQLTKFVEASIVQLEAFIVDKNKNVYKDYNEEDNPLNLKSEIEKNINILGKDPSLKEMLDAAQLALDNAKAVDWVVGELGDSNKEVFDKIVRGKIAEAKASLSQFNELSKAYQNKAK